MILQNKKLKKTMNNMEEDYEETIATMKAAIVEPDDENLNFASGDSEGGVLVSTPLTLDSNGVEIKTVKIDEEVRKFVEENPEIAAKRIRDWLNGAD